MEDWEFEEKKWRFIHHLVGYVVGAAVLFALVWFAARCCRGTSHDPFVMMCHEWAARVKEEASQ